MHEHDFEMNSQHGLTQHGHVEEIVIVEEQVNGNGDPCFLLMARHVMILTR